jgi:hypothetical protein
MTTNTNFGEEAVKLLIFSSPVYLDRNDFPVKEAFHKVLKFNNFLKHLRFEFQGVNPGEYAKIINKANIILLLPVLSALAIYGVVKITRSCSDVVLRTKKHTIVYPGSDPSLKVIALRPAV